MIKTLTPLFLVLGIALGGCSSAGNSKLRSPNVLIILTDDQGWGDLSVNGNSNLHTPNIDEMVAEGASFRNFYVCPVCSPTRAEVLTGRYHLRGGVRSTSAGGERLDLDEETIVEVFKRAGYATAAYGKWHNGMQPPYHPNSRGFDDYYGFCSGHWGNYFDPMLEHNGRLVRGSGFIIDDLTRHGMEFMEKHADESFFLYLPFNTPHGPLQVPDRWWDQFSEKEIGMTARDENPENLNFTRAALAMCENIDWNVGRLQNKIRELGIEENTIVLYFCDNGPNSWRWNGDMKGKKGSTDEGGVRSPLFMTWPGHIEKGKEIKEISSGIDLLPTLADLAGIKFSPPKPLDGLSLKPLLLEKNPLWYDRYIFNYWGGRLSVRNQKYRLDHNGALFDIEADRGQRNDMGASFPKIKEQMALAAETFRKEVVSELTKQEQRPFTIGAPGSTYTQLPARDGVGHGNIQRSNRWPNCSFYTNWISLDDSLTWDVEVLEDGSFDVILYYTCPKGDENSVFELSLGSNTITGQILEAHDPPLYGPENDRDPRHNSPVKDFKALNLGKIHLSKGRGQLCLKATEMPGQSVMDLRLIMFERK